MVPAVHIARDGIGLADRAIETRESGAIRRNRIRPGPWRLHCRAWFGLSPVRGNRLDRRLCSANVIMEPRWRPAKQRCPDPATALALILVGGRSDGPYRGRSRMLFVSRGTESSQTLRWREMDSNHRSRHGETPLGRAIWFPRTAPTGSERHRSEEGQKVQDASRRPRLFI